MTIRLETQQEDSFDQIIGYKDVHLKIYTYMIGFMVISDIYILTLARLKGSI